MVAAASQPLLLSIAKSLEQTSIALLVRESLWGFQITVGLHILGMILSVGTVVWMDLRLLGVSMRRVPVSVAYRQLMPWAGAGFVVMLVTGSMLLMAYASNAYENPYFRAKLLALTLAGLNALVYHTTIERRIDQWDATSAAAASGADGRSALDPAVGRRRPGGPVDGLHALLTEGLRPSDSPTRSLARRFAGALRSRGSLARSLATQVSWIARWLDTR